ncbi:cytochrome C oxidase subunit IV family protein [Pseudomonas sp. GD03721]|uniref:cytochrome C oxidase subunit IV family protein n=1 Tax=Pseudomonas TaxID=286 RepID=UPI00093FE634|nr:MULTISPECIES: cytochrome C oxidase subunit IV family protein [Pseudomonas]MDH0639352.1 cytochrome C oxidase subunit IV family protein [Pseudomonas sp. GD03860]MDH1440463.1 cytochrome C oxidase subunit IV family protein [Pseudomonas sp. GD03722]WGG03449.1 cytochrome C oxidase subunit IV family protein [Pseudomonas sp. GD03721]WGG07617.1 cytochrome C oxidase subunit IV family protein [Pseudomonas sp. GD03919]
MIWLFLVLATLGSTWLAGHHSFAGEWTVVFVMLVAYIKGRAIMLYFMDLRAANPAWRLPFEVWGIASAAVIIGFWLQAANG